MTEIQLRPAVLFDAFHIGKLTTVIYSNRFKNTREISPIAALQDIQSTDSTCLLYTSDAADD